MRLILLALIVSFHAHSYQQFYDEDVYGQTYQDSFNYMDDNDFGQGMHCSPGEEGALSVSPQPENRDDVQDEDPPIEPFYFIETPLKESKDQID